ncbi:putative virion structural protein [Pseudomonas phage OBP]|uniref:virion structural protein n=1 Tax=Pseudomonas phage OBP TaxID=1124849 RepID=UPI000240D49B|nr:virion structural protein [Pseudomonas phage OBP]AEV89546.1 putative virion structural protein [Pseudomonas phage OBP]
MTASVLKDLKMAEISLAKVQDVGKMTDEARDILNNFRTDVRIKETVQNALENIESKQDYELTPSIAAEIDNVINTHSDMAVRAGQPVIAGTEAFGISLLPAEWRRTRALALREMLDETYRNIKRWANQLSDNFQRTWVELHTSTEVLETRLESLDATIDVVGEIKEGFKTIELNELIARSISKSGKVITTDLDRTLLGDVNYIMSCIKLWEMEQVRFKNTIIRYFGNKNNTDITVIKREIPKMFDQRLKAPGEDISLLAMGTRPMLDGHYFEGLTVAPQWIKDNIKGPEDATTYAEALSHTGYHVISDEKYRVNKTTVNILTLNQIYGVRDIINTIINRLKSLNVESDPVNFNPDDVKDVLNSLRAAESGEARALQYGTITADYQFDVNGFKTGVSGALTVLASHLITMLNQHLECYTVEQ